MKRSTSILLGLVIFACLFGLAAPAWADETQGKIMSVSTDKQQIVVMDNTARPKTFHVANGCVIMVNNQKSQLSDLKSGDDVMIFFERQEDTLMAREVRCNR